MGSLLGIVLSLMANSMGQISTGQVVRFADLPFSVAWLITGFSIPVVEEEALRGTILPTAAEDIGIIPALLLTSIFFVLLHWTLFGPQMFLIAFVFSLIAGVLALHERSVIPAAFMHIAYNTAILVIIQGVPF